jgi:putative chitinase
VNTAASCAAGFPTEAGVRAALDALKAASSATWATPLAAACQRHGINTPKRVAAFLANVCHETGGLRSTTENLNYTPDRLMALFGRSGRITASQAQQYGRTASHPANQEAIANTIYGGAWGLRNLGNTQPQDGWFFRGKGLIQLTGRANHTKFAKSIGVDVVKLQDLLATPEGAAESAAMFWAARNCNACADCGDHAGHRKLVNGGNLGLQEVVHGAGVALAALLPFER